MSYGNLFVHCLRVWALDRAPLAFIPHQIKDYGVGSPAELARKIFSLTKDAETGQQGYILTGEPSYLEPYQTAVNQLEQKVRNFRQLTADNPNQQHAVETLEPLVRDKLAVLEEAIDLRRTQGLESAITVVRSGRSQQLMDEIRRTIKQMEAEERKLLRLRAGAADIAARETIESVTYGIPLALLMLMLLGVLLNPHISKPLDDISKVAEKIGGRDGIATLGRVTN